MASGVQFVVDGKKFVANASKEVILSAGAIQTPQLLELSGAANFNYHCLRRVNSCRITGIGNPTHLAAIGIQSLVDLPGVGENLLVSDLPAIQRRKCIPEHENIGPYLRIHSVRSKIGHSNVW
jgi:GMC oxidoreductase